MGWVGSDKRYTTGMIGDAMEEDACMQEGRGGRGGGSANLI